MQDQGTKTCGGCKAAKPLEQFYKQAAGKFGRAGQCIECVKAQRAMHRAANLDRIRAENRERVRAHRARVGHKPTSRERIRAWEQRHPEAKRAHWAVKEAVKRGQLVRQPCEVCGAERVHGHHPDYSKPLDVRWLCPAHHGEVHRLPRET